MLQNESEKFICKSYKLHKDFALCQFGRTSHIIIPTQDFAKKSYTGEKSMPSVSSATENINAEIIAIGTEILLGEITDTNSVHIARVLRDQGINLYFMTSVGDNEKRIADAIRIAMQRAQVVITCGGLGPTVDDMTRQAVAAATERGLTFHQELLDQIAARFATFKVTMTENNRQQAYLPDRALALENPVGTAPAFIVEHEDRAVISLPGVPREMKFLMTEKVVPYLRQKYRLGIIKAKVLRTAGIGESMLDDQLGKDLLEASNPTVGLAAHMGQVDVRITAKAEDETTADTMIADFEAKIRQRVGRYIYGINQEKLEDVLATLLHKHGITLAVNETGITQTIGARLYEAALKVGGLQVIAQSYDDPDGLRATLGLNKDVTMRALAQSAAEALHRETNAAVAVAVVARPDVNESADSQEASAVAIFTPEQSSSRAYGFGAQAENARSWVSTWSLSWIWRMLHDKYESNHAG
jgi:nicotinamide-nucleotide amidase